MAEDTGYDGNQGFLTPDQIAANRAYAQAMLKQSMEPAVAGTGAYAASSPWLGASKLMEALVGGLSLHKAGQDENLSRQFVGHAQPANLAIEQTPSSTLPGRVSSAEGGDNTSAYADTIQKAAAQYGVDPQTLTKLISQESRGNPNAYNPSGAAGIAQFMKPTAQEYGVDVHDPKSSIDGAARYLADLHRQFGGNWGHALMAYNVGPGELQKWLAGRRDLPAETRNYVQSITGRAPEDWRTPQSASRGPAMAFSGSPVSDAAPMGGSPVATTMALAPPTTRGLPMGGVMMPNLGSGPPKVPMGGGQMAQNILPRDAIPTQPTMGRQQFEFLMGPGAAYLSPKERERLQDMYYMQHQPQKVDIGNGNTAIIGRDGSVTPIYNMQSQAVKGRGGVEMFDNFVPMRDPKTGMPVMVPVQRQGEDFPGAGSAAPNAMPPGIAPPPSLGPSHGSAPSPSLAPAPAGAAPPSLGPPPPTAPSQAAPAPPAAAPAPKAPSPVDNIPMYNVPDQGLAGNDALQAISKAAPIAGAAEGGPLATAPPTAGGGGPLAIAPPTGGSEPSPLPGTPEDTGAEKGPKLAQASPVPPRFERFMDWNNQKELEFEAAKTRANKDAEEYYKTLTETQQGEHNSYALKNQLETARTIINDPNFNQGPWTPIRQAINKIKMLWGDKAAEHEQALYNIFDKKVAGTILDTMQSKLHGLGQVRNAEIDLMRLASASQLNTVEANRAIVDVALKEQERAAMLGKIANAYHTGYRWDGQGNPIKDARGNPIRTNSPPNAVELRDALNRYLEMNPAYTPEQIERYTKMFQGDAQGKPSAAPTQPAAPVKVPLPSDLERVK